MQSNPIPLRQIPLFRGIAEENLSPLLTCLGNYIRTYRRGEFVLLDQDRVQHVGVVLSGAVHILKEDIWGHQTLVAYMDQGDLFGATFALQKAARSCVSVLVAQDARVLFLSLQNLLHPCRKQCGFHTLLTQNMFDLMGERNMRLMEKIEVSSKRSLREKILAYLSIQAQKQESRYIAVPLNRAEMASFLQSNRSAMTRELAAMRREGLIDFAGNLFELKDGIRDWEKTD